MSNRECMIATDHPYSYKRVAILMHNMHSNVQLAHSKHAGIMHSNVSLARGAALDCRFAGKGSTLASAPLELTTLGLRECWLAEVKPFRRTTR